MALRFAYHHYYATSAAVCALLLAGSLIGCARESDNTPLVLDGTLTERGLEEAARITSCADLEAFVARACEGFTARSKSAHNSFMLQYRPAVLQACLTQGAASGSKTSDLLSEVAASGVTDTYVMKVPRTDRGTEKAASEEFLLYLSDAASKDIVQVSGTDTVPCAFIHVESTPAIGPYHHVILGFDPSPDGDQPKIVWHDGSGSLGGDLVFEFKAGAFDLYERILAQALTNSNTTQ